MCGVLSPIWKSYFNNTINTKIQFLTIDSIPFSNRLILNEKSCKIMHENQLFYVNKNIKKCKHSRYNGQCHWQLNRISANKFRMYLIHLKHHCTLLLFVILRLIKVQGTFCMSIFKCCRIYWWVKFYINNHCTFLKRSGILFFNIYIYILKYKKVGI